MKNVHTIEFDMKEHCDIKIQLLYQWRSCCFVCACYDSLYQVTDSGSCDPQVHNNNWLVDIYDLHMLLLVGPYNFYTQHPKNNV
jgi:hypothetical protein